MLLKLLLNRTGIYYISNITKDINALILFKTIHITKEKPLQEQSFQKL